MLLWNPLYPEGRDSYPRRVGKWSENPCSWCREEIWVAFTDRQCKRWTQPVVIARKPGAQLAYFNVFEHKPGQVWISSGGVGVQVELRVADFVDS